MDFFAVSLFDGYNRPMLVCPTPSTASPGGNCTATGSLVDLNGLCSSNLKVILSDSGGQSVACKSACNAFGKPEFCCIRLLEFVYSGISGRVILRPLNHDQTVQIIPMWKWGPRDTFRLDVLYVLLFFCSQQPPAHLATFQQAIQSI
ncbi:hypothetical protein IEQ34_005843 [Dendrobium chrysotoxum]|uniref:Uncharacterized protein n=1 Tax=Dendrobium chrysotoxum TaxID=161865 RepID=A0AAV7HE47_DENCH|nr:hypothetical protein IEQ34_005843 [Dendrobium chrysotoxum]